MSKLIRVELYEDEVQILVNIYRQRVEFLEFAAQGHLEATKRWQERAEKAEAALAAREEEAPRGRL